MTSLPSSISNALNATNTAAVPELTASAYPPPKNSELAAEETSPEGVGALEM